MITLEVAKQHLRVVHADEDALIEAYLAAAHEHVQNEVGGEFISNGLLIGGVLFDPSPVLNSAVLLTLGALYEQRDGDAKEIPGAVAALVDLSPHRRRMGAA